MYNKQQSIKIKNNVGSTNMYFIRDNKYLLSMFKANVFGYVLNTKMYKTSKDVKHSKNYNYIL